VSRAIKSAIWLSFEAAHITLSCLLFQANFSTSALCGAGAQTKGIEKFIASKWRHWEISLPRREEIDLL
jgi:hypothetical protein